MDQPKHPRKTGRAIRWSIGTAIAVIVGAGTYGWFVRPRLSSEIGIIRLRDRELSPAAAGLLALARERLRIRRAA